MERGASIRKLNKASQADAEHASAAVRGAASFYADYLYTEPAIRTCRGLSCHLARPAGKPSGGAAEQPVYCLGYCDQSPVSILPDHTVHTGPGSEPAYVPKVRCTASRPVVTARLLEGDHAELARARAAGVYSALATWLESNHPDGLLETVVQSGEQGRGGAGFLTGEKWRACAAAPGTKKIVIANGDEGDPGSYIDRLLLERDPHAILEGLALCAFAVGASHGLIYVRSEYPQARQCMEQAINDATAAGIIGPAVMGSEFAFAVEVVAGHGSYVCGEETALLNSIEGKRGEVRLRPPYPTEAGLYGLPTVVNNIETLVNIPWIAQHGAGEYRQLGVEGAHGTKAMCLNYGFAHPGIVEVEFGTSLRTVIEELGGGGSAGHSIEAIALGGPMGSVLTAMQWDVPVDYRAMHATGVELGHGGMVAFVEGTDYRDVIRHWLEFMALESCGRCVVCRLGSRQALNLVASLDKDRAELEALLGVIASGSLCAFGRNIPTPVRQLLALID
jgi:NADH:ubiquinone oxidoreductase subunit F (NADH-binding)